MQVVERSVECNSCVGINAFMTSTICFSKCINRLVRSLHSHSSCSSEVNEFNPRNNLNRFLLMLPRASLCIDIDRPPRDRHEHVFRMQLTVVDASSVHLLYGFSDLFHDRQKVAIGQLATRHSTWCSGVTIFTRSCRHRTQLTQH